MNQMTIYHLKYEDDATARRAFDQVGAEVHAVGGARWASWGHGSSPAYIVVALLPTTDPATVPCLEGLEPVANTAANFEELDPVFTAPVVAPVTVPVVEDAAI